MQSPLIEYSPRSRSHRLASRRYRRQRMASVAVVVALVLVAGLGVAAWASDRLPWRPGKNDSVGSPSPKTSPAAAASEATASGTTRTSPVDSTVPSAGVVAPPAFQPARPATITVSAVGDMIFDRRVKELIATKGGLAPLAKVAPLLADADVTVGNLESNLSSSGSPKADKDVTFRGHPRGIEGLAASGFDFVALGNNHVLDYGPDSLRDTLAALDAAGIGHAGAGMNRSQAWTPAVVTRDGATVAFLSFSHILPAGFVATDSQPGLARGRGNMDKVGAAIADAKSRYDYVLVSFHWGVEYKDFANGDQVRDAHRAIDAGADMVLSHHPHVIQGVEFYKGRLIAYSLGDFVFDHYSRKTGEAFVLDAELGPDGVTNAVATPVYLNGSGAPAVVTGGEATTILKRLAQISKPHGTTVRIDGNVAGITP